LNKNLDSSYKKRYQVSLIENIGSSRNNGISAFLESERTRWKCRYCDGVVSLQDKICSNCGQGLGEE
jgi:ribosomal protein S27AE